MKKSELIKLRTIYSKELERLTRIKKLLNEEQCRELIELSKIDVSEFREIDSLKILHDILQNFRPTETNGIYVCIGTYIDWLDYDIASSRSVPFYDKDAEYRCYRDIENRGYVKAYTSPSLYPLFTSTFEQENIVLNPYSSNKNDNGYDEVRDEFFMNCINLGQAKSKRLILEKYKRI